MTPAEQFFADCQRDGRTPNVTELEGWLWFTCPANQRTQARAGIEADPRYLGKRLIQTEK